MPINFEPEFEPETKASKSFAPAFEPEFEAEKPSTKGASSIPGAEDYKVDHTPVEEKKKLTKENILATPDIEHGVKVAQDVIKPLLAGFAAYPAALVAGPVQSAIDLAHGQPSNVFQNMENVNERVAGLAGAPQTAEGEELNKQLQENLYRHLPAMGATGFHVTPLAKQQAMAARMREMPIIPEKMGPMIPNEIRATRAGVGPVDERIGPMIPAEQRAAKVGPSADLATAADVEALRGVLSDDSVNALKERVAKDREMTQANLAQLEELAQKDEQERAAQRPNLTSLEDEQGQQSLFDQGDQMGQRNQFNAGDLGDWRIDENGMPVRIDKSMEAANLGEPLQRGLWGDELGPALGNDRSLTGAIDSLPAGAHRDMALERLQGPVDALPELNAALLDAEGHKFGFEPENTTFQPKAPLPTQTLREVMAQEAKRQPPEIALNTFVKAKTKDGTEVVLHRTAREGDYTTLTAYDAQGNHLGDLDYMNLADNYEGQPVIHVDEGARRQGVATLLYDTAHRNGGYIPGKSSKNAVRTDMGIAFRNKWEPPTGPFTEPSIKPELPPGVNIVKTEDGFVATQNGKQVGSLISNMTPEQGKGIGYEIPASVSSVKVSPEVRGTGIGRALYDAWSAEHGRENVMPSGQTTADAWKYWKRNNPEAVGRFAEQEAQRVREGSQNALTSITDPEVRRMVADRVAGDAEVKAVVDYQPSAEPYSKEPVTPVAAEVAPAVGVMNNIPGMKDKMRHIRPMMETAQQIIDKFKDVGDIAQNIGQRFLNQVTKGSIYNAMRIDHPYYTKVTQRFRDADSNIQAAIRDVIHAKGAYADTLKKLSKDEYTRLAQEVQQAWRDERELTPDYLRSKGFSENGITAAASHKAFTEKLYSDYLKPAADLAGIKNVRQDISYFAGRTSGDFRKVITKDGEYVGQLAADTRRGLNKKVEAFRKLKEAAGTEVGPEAYMGDRRRTDVSQGAAQFGQWLYENHPEMAGYVDIINQLNDDLAAHYMGAEKHTMQKKGTLGIQGADPTLGVFENAKDFWNSQVQYGENVIKWAEKSKAMADVKPLMETAGKPNLNAVIKQYVDNSMGRNPNQVGRAIDGVEAAVGKLMGVSPNLMRNFAGGLKQGINIKLLAFSPKFYWGNLTQSITRTPEMMSYLKTLGVDPSFLGSSEMTKGMLDAVSIGPKSQLVKDAEAYAQRTHVYSSDLFETNNRTRNGVGSAIDKLTVPAAIVEQYTRKSFYLTAVDALAKHGMVGDELFGTAKNLTDMYMNNYAKEEGALSYNVLGKSGGSNSANLMSFNNNETSRLAMNINLAAKGQPMPLATQLIAQIATAGVMGVVGFKEADALVKQISQLVGKPLSLSLLLSQSDGVPDIMKYGAPSVATGVDLTSTGAGSVIQGLPGGGITDVFMPGVSALGAPAKAAVPVVADLLKGNSPKKYDMLKLVREMAPTGPAQGYLDRKLSHQAENGNELGINQNTMKGQVQRTEADKIAKNFGVTGLHEAMEKNKNYQLADIDKFYHDKRQEAIKDWSRAILTKNPEDQKGAIKDYFKNEGGQGLQADLEKAVNDGFISEDMRKIIAAQAGDIPQTKSLMRRFAR